MKCQNCGNELNNNAKFCTYCGTPVQAEAPTAPAAPEQPPVYVPPVAPVQEQPATPEQPPVYAPPSIPEQPVVPVAPVAPAAPEQPPVYVPPVAPVAPEQPAMPENPPVYTPPAAPQYPQQPNVPPVPPYPVAPQQKTDASKGKDPIFKKWWFWAIIAAVVVLVIAIVAVAAGGSDDEKDYDNDVITTEEVEDIEEETEEETEKEKEEETTEEHDDSFNDYDDGYNYDDDEDISYVDVVLGEKITVDGLVEITLDECGWTDELYASKEEIDEWSYTPISDIEGETYVVVKATVKNISTEEINFARSYIECVFNETYTYNETVDLLYETSNGTDLSYYYDEITPMQTITLYIVCSVADEMYQNTETFELYFGFDKEMNSASYYGFDACDYIYRAGFTNDGE